MNIFSKKKPTYSVEALHLLCKDADSLKPALERTLAEIKQLIAEVKSFSGLIGYVKREVIPKVAGKAMMQDIPGCFEILGSDPVLGPVLNSAFERFQKSENDI